jgi:hypothetical protein
MKAKALLVLTLANMALLVFSLTQTRVAAAASAQAPVRPLPALVTVPATPPDTLPRGFYADSNTAQPSAIFAVRFIKQALFVRFMPNATVDARTAAVSLVQGTVIGGTDGYYMLRVPDDGTGAGIKAAMNTLNALPAVDFSAPQLVDFLAPAYRLPHDGAGTSETALSRLRADGVSVPGGVAVAFARVPGSVPTGDSIRIMLTSKRNFTCAAALAVEEVRDATQVSLRVTHVLTSSSCNNATSRATWRTIILATAGPHEVVVVANGVTDRFHVGSGTTGWCVVAEAGPSATPLIAGPHPNRDSPASQNTENFEMVGFPNERLPAC